MCIVSVRLVFVHEQNVGMVNVEDVLKLINLLAQGCTWKIIKDKIPNL